jgi:hypothetical protein
MRRLTNALLRVGILPLPGAMLAADFDGKAPRLCASSHSVECASDGRYKGGSSQHLNLPHVLRIDFKAKNIRAQEPTDVKLTTSIEHVTNDDGTRVLQGVVLDGAGAW